MDITLRELSLFLGALGTIISFAALVTVPLRKYFKQHGEDHERILKRLSQLENCDNDTEAKLDEATEQREVLLKALFGILSGFKEQGLNGQVTTSHDLVMDYLKSKPFR